MSYDICRFVDVMIGKGKWQRGSLDGVQGFLSLRSGEMYLSTVAFSKDAHDLSQASYGPLWFDFDGPNSFEHTKKLIRYLRASRVEPGSIRIKISGLKGYHIGVAPEALGIQMAVNLHVTQQIMAREICEAAGVLESFDHRLYATRHVIRVAGSKHQESGLISLPFDADVFLEMTEEQVKQAAAQTPEQHDPSWHFFSGSPSDLSKMYKTCSKKALEQVSDARPIINPATDDATDPKDFPVCVKSLEETGPLASGLRNQTAFQLALFYKELGLTQQAAKERLRSWMKTSVNPAFTSTHDPKANDSAVNSVYASKTAYRSCATILSCSPEKGGIACLGPSCSYVKKASKRMQEVLEQPTTDIQEFEGTINHDADRPMRVLSGGTWACSATKDKDPCGTCSLKKTQLSYTTDDPAILASLTQATKAQQMDRLRALSRIGCKAGKPIAPIYVTVHDAVVQEPPPDWSQTQIEQPPEATVYYTGNRATPGQLCAFQGSPIQIGPQNLAILASKQPVPVDPGWLGYRHPTPDQHKLLSRLKHPGDPMEMLRRLNEHFVANVHRIVGRNTASITALLCSAAPLSMRIQRTGRDVRARINAKLIGDTGTGKTSITDGIMEYIQLGRRITAKDASRAGLIGGKEKVGAMLRNRSGMYARQHGQWTVTDEWHAAAPDVANACTDLLDRGQTVVSKVGSEIVVLANGRYTMISNPVKGKWRRSCDMADRTFGVQHLTEVMQSAENLRRIDIALGFDRETISRQVYASKPTCDDDLMNQELAYLHWRWCWARSAGDVLVLEETEDYAMEAGRQLCDRYDPSIKLMIDSDAGHKVMRVAACIATLQYNVNDEGIVLVEPRHVDASKQLFIESYDSPDLDYIGYSNSQAIPIENLLQFREDFGKYVPSVGSFITPLFESCLAMQGDTFQAEVITKTLTKSQTGFAQETAVVEAIGFLLRKRWLRQAGGRELELTTQGRKNMKAFLAKDTRSLTKVEGHEKLKKRTVDGFIAES